MGAPHCMLPPCQFWWPYVFTAQKMKFSIKDCSDCGSEDIFLICHVTSQNYFIKASCDYMDSHLKVNLKVSHHPAKFRDHRHCGGVDIIYLVVKEQDSTCLLKPPSFISKAHGMKAYDMLCSVLVTETKNSNKWNIGKNCCRSVQKHRREEKSQKQKPSC